MTEIYSEPFGTWTAYPSLLSSLGNDAERKFFEEVACAHYCGRYTDAEKIFNTQLPQCHTKPILAFQRADMLTSQGREPERVKLLELSLSTLSQVQDSESVPLLLQFMLADAIFWAFGKMKLALDLLPIVRGHLRSRGMDNLSDVEIRCLTLYYEVVDNFEKFSNFLGEDSKTIFQDGNPDKSVVLKRLRQMLQAQKRWRSAATIMQQELKYTLEPSRLELTTEDAFKLCKTLESFENTSLKFRCIILKKDLIGRISEVDPERSEVTEQEVISTLEKICPKSYPEWEIFCPALAVDLRKAQILKSASTMPDTLAQLLQLIKESKQRQENTLVNQIYISARNVANRWLEQAKGTAEESTALQQLRTVQESLIDFHRLVTGIVVWEAAALTDFINILYVRYHDYSSMLRKVLEFEQQHSEFEVPISLERLYWQALTAAKILGKDQKLRDLDEKHQEWLLKCPFMKESGGLTDEAIFDSDFAAREIQSNNATPVEWGSNSIRLMLRWAGSEWNKNIISLEDCKCIFGPGLDRIPHLDLTERLTDQELKILSDSIFGEPDDPVDIDMFLYRYGRLQDWILARDKLPSRSLRIFALRIFLESRLYRIREYLTAQGLPEVQQVRALEEEYAELVQLKELEAQEKNSHVDIGVEEKELSIHNTLVKCFVPSAVFLGLIEEVDLISQATECRNLITFYHNSGKQLHEYHAVIQLIQLTWQRYLKFNTIPPESIMPLVNEADKIFVQTRNLVTGLSPPEDLIARIKLSSEFSHREHHAFALAGRYTGFETYRIKMMTTPTEQIKNLALANYQALLYWAFRSKGRGFVDILHLESDVSHAIAKSKLAESSQNEVPGPIENSKTNSQSGTTGLESKLGKTSISTTLLDPSNEQMVTKQGIDTMLQNLPDGVVLVDFINVSRANTLPTSLIALVYKKGTFNLPTKISNLSMLEVGQWVRDNLEADTKDRPGQLRSGRMSNPSSSDKLGQLSGLLESLRAIIKPGETVIFCPTGSLNRIPIHAIPMDGKPFIERNPVGYCQSLTILYWLWLKFQNRPVQQPAEPKPKRTVINPMPEVWKDDKPVTSTTRVKKLVQDLQAEFHHGFNLKNSTVTKAISGSSIFHYHGHVTYKNPRSGLNSALVLNEKAHKSAGKIKRHPGSEFLTAREFFQIQLCEPALATIIGCGSGMAVISNNDDVLGIPTAMFYAGASSVVSTLWPIEDEDGAAFGTAFYGAVKGQMRDRVEDKTEGNLFERVVDLAVAMQKAVLELRGRKGAEEPYHWAAFTLNGFWLLPERLFDLG